MQAAIDVVNLVFAFVEGGLAMAALKRRANIDWAAAWAMRVGVGFAGFYVLLGIYAALHHSWLWLYTPFVLAATAGLGWLRWKITGTILRNTHLHDAPEPPTA